MGAYCRFYDFIGYIEQTTFGIACDAQANFKVSGVGVAWRRRVAKRAADRSSPWFWHVGNLDAAQADGGRVLGTEL